MKILIKNINLITPYELLKDYVVFIEEGKITQFQHKDKFIGEYHVDEVIDGKGNYLAPGFIDIHNHGNMGYDIMDSTEEALDIMGKFHLKNGVTSYLGTVITSSYSNMCNAISNIVEYKNKDDLSQLIGIHLEGPFFSMEKKGAQPGKYIILPDLEEMEKVVKLSANKLKMVSIAPEIPGALEVISYLRSEDITIGMAHSNANFEEAMNGINYGATVATHLYNGMRNFTHREPGTIGASLVDERVFCELIYDRIHLHDAAAKIAIGLKGLDKIVLISDAMRATGLPDGEFELGGQKVFVRGKIAQLASGNLAGSTLTLRESVYNLINYLGISVVDAIRMASLSPAKAIGIDKYKGSIEVGKDADFIIFDKDINIIETIVNGKRN